MTIHEIKKEKLLIKGFITYFLEVLKDHNDYLLPETLDDYVLDVFEKQGKWQGISHEYIWNADLNDFTVNVRGAENEKEIKN